jgi:aspartyl-tRNA synthetase
VPQELSRAELGSLEELAKEWGGKGLAYLVFDEEGEVRSPIAKFLSAELIEAVRPEEPSATVLFGADEPLAVARVLSAVRNHLGRELGLIDTSRDEFLWVTDFPLFEWDEDGKRWTFSHHPFTGVRPGDEDLIESDPGRALSQAYDLVWNGWELGSGSIRSTTRCYSSASSPRWASAKRRRRSGSASCSRCCAWARRRTAGSRWGWSASSRCSRASRTSARWWPSRRPRAGRNL